MSKIRAVAAPGKKEIERVSSEALKALEIREYIILGLALLSACEYGEYGKKRANELVDLYMKNTKIHEDYEDNVYSFRIIKEKLAEHGIDAETLFQLSKDFKSSVQEVRKQKKDTQLKGTEYLKVRKQMEEIRLAHKTYREGLKDDVSRGFSQRSGE